MAERNLSSEQRLLDSALSGLLTSQGARFGWDGASSSYIDYVISGIDELNSQVRDSSTGLTLGSVLMHVFTRHNFSPEKMFTFLGSWDERFPDSRCLPLREARELLGRETGLGD